MNLFLSVDWLMLLIGYEMTLNVDHFVVMYKTEAETIVALGMMRYWTELETLILHPSKTKIVNADEETFAFLGYKFKQGMKFPADKSIRKLRDNIRYHNKTIGKCGFLSLDRFLNELCRCLK